MILGTIKILLNIMDIYTFFLNLFINLIFISTLKVMEHLIQYEKRSKIYTTPVR